MTQHPDKRKALDLIEEAWKIARDNDWPQMREDINAAYCRASLMEEGTTPEEPTATPGPWRWNNKGGVLVLYGGEGYSVVLRTQPQAGNDYDLTQEDARVIVAAPDLLEAAEAARAGIMNTPALDGSGDWYPIIDALTAAIDKATKAP